MPYINGHFEFPSIEEMQYWCQNFCEGINMVSRGNARKETDQFYTCDEEKSEKSAYEELMGLVGLENVKETIKREMSYHRIMELRSRSGRPTPHRLPHILLVGNPGSGKTTVAKLIGRVYYENGILKNDNFIETNRAMLVGQFIGESEAHTSDFIKQAEGGVLFIDEIYSLAGDDRKDSRDFGKKVVDTLILEERINFLQKIYKGINSQ